RWRGARSCGAGGCCGTCPQGKAPRTVASARCWVAGGGCPPLAGGHPPSMRGSLLLQLAARSAVRILGGVHVDVVAARLLQDRVDRALLLAGHAALRRPRRLREERDEDAHRVA